jgi:hypothetical protein
VGLRQGLALLALAASLAGCERIVDAVETRVEQELQEAVDKAPEHMPQTPSSTLLPAEQLVVKLNLYVDCQNRSRDRIMDSHRRWSELVRDKDGLPRNRDGDVPPAITRVDADLEGCRAAVDDGPTIAPPLPEIELSAATYLAAAQGYARVARSLHEYYETEAYEEDAWLLGKQLATELATAYTEWEATSTMFFDAIDGRKDDADVAMLALVETRSGRKLEWHSQAYVIAAKRFVRCVERGVADFAACEPGFRAVERAHGDFAKYHDAHRDEAAATFWMSSFAAEVDETFALAQQVAQALQDGKPKRADLPGLMSEYNDLVGAANRLKFDFPGGA